MMYSKKSTTCFGKQTGEPLTEYQSVAEAHQAANYVSGISGNAMVAYACTQCDKWHLSPADRQTPSVYCNSCGKYLYATKQTALQRAEILHKEKGAQLSVYACGDGWHLTKQ